MPVNNAARAKRTTLWAKLLGCVKLPVAAGRPDRRKYTFMVVPHHGKNVYSLRFPIQALKLTAIVAGVLALVTVGTVISYRNQINEASVEKAELQRLRQVNAVQNGQITELAKATAALQEDMTRLNQLDSDLRRMVNSDEQQTSRGGTVRPPSNYTGQGGPVVKPQIGELMNLVNDLQANAKAREQSLNEMKAALIQKNERMSATPSIWPADGEVSSRFGWRWGGDWHPGIDIANDYGTPISAAAAGVVTYSGWYSGYGNLVQIDHGNGIVTLYGHCSSLLVNVGDQVKKGDLIAYMGSTGFSTGNHVHYEIRVNGTPVNPANFL